MSINRLYSSLRPFYIAKSAVGVLFGGVGLFCAYELFSGNERFHREVATPLLHRILDAEKAHRLGIVLAKFGMFASSEENRKEYEVLGCTLFGRKLLNPIGVAAGFDKNGEAISGLQASGLGFVEVGSVTPRPQPGNPRPRVWRLARDEAVINCYGFNSDGVGTVLERVKKATSQAHSPTLLGVNLGKNKATLEAVHDYEIGTNYFAPHCDYLVVNVSSPNTPGLRSLQSKQELVKILKTLRASLRRMDGSTSNGRAPPKLLVKISPDMPYTQLKDIAKVFLNARHGVDGLVISNTTTQRPQSLKDLDSEMSGGLSGAPLREISTECIAKMYRLTEGQIPIIGCGGVSNGAHAYEKICAGASAIQLYTALVYQGFPVIGRVKRELAELLRRDGYENVGQAVGTKNGRARPR